MKKILSTTLSRTKYTTCSITLRQYALRNTCMPRRAIGLQCRHDDAVTRCYSIPAAAASWWWWWLSSGWSEVLVVCRLDDVVSVTPAVLTRVASVGRASQWVTLSGSQCSLVVSRLNAAASGFFVSSLMSSTDRQWLLVSIHTPAAAAQTDHHSCSPASLHFVRDYPGQQVPER